MSRGHGKTQRAILDYLARERGTYGVRWSRVHDLVDAAYPEATDSWDAKYVAVRRAVRTLGAEGAIEVGGGGPNPLRARRLLTEDEEREERERKAKRDAWFERFSSELSDKVDRMLAS